MTNNYACYISFPCPECGLVITPSGLALSVTNPNLHGVSLEQACRDGNVTLQTLQSILTTQFECETPHKPVCPADAGKVTLVGVAPADRSSDQSG